MSKEMIAHNKTYRLIITSRNEGYAIILKKLKSNEILRGAYVKFSG